MPFESILKQSTSPVSLNTHQMRFEQSRLPGFIYFIFYSDHHSIAHQTLLPVFLLVWTKTLLNLAIFKTTSATDYQAPASLSLLVCHTGSPRWFATQALLLQLVALAASPISMPFVDTLLPTPKILPHFSELGHVLPSPCYTDSSHRFVLPSDPSPEPAAQRCSSPSASSSSQIRYPHPQLRVASTAPLLSVSVSTWSTLQ